MKPTLLLALLTLPSCGPMLLPAVHRLDPDTQFQVNNAWNNMLTPPARLDRDLLLDVILACQLHTLGVDRLDFRSEKDTSAGKVVMTVRYDRAYGTDSRFTVSVTSPTGQPLRQEQYTGEEIIARAARWNDDDRLPGEDPEQPTTREIRLARITAATQPTPR